MNPENFFPTRSGKASLETPAKASTCTEHKNTSHNQDQTDQLSDNFSARSATIFLFLDQLKIRLNVNF